MRAQMEKIRAATNKPINVNFFVHRPPVPNNAREHAWRERLKPYYLELGIDPGAPVPSSNRTPFDAALCAAVEEIKPEVVSFHFGLPEPVLLKRVKAAGCVVMSSATTVAEAIGPINSIAPEFPLAGGALAPLHAKAQEQGSGDFSSMWAGQAAALGRELPAREVTIKLAEEAQALMRRMAPI